MKLRYNHTLLMIALLALGACADSAPTLLIPPGQAPPSDIQQTFIDNITSGSWNVGQNGTITRDNVDVSDQFTQFVLTFNDDFTYTTSGGGDLFPDGDGTWSFVSDTQADLIIVGGVEMTASVSATQLSLIFGIDDPEQAVSGRVADLSGDYHVTVLK